MRYLIGIVIGDPRAFLSGLRHCREEVSADVAPSVSFVSLAECEAWNAGRELGRALLMLDRL